MCVKNQKTQGSKGGLDDNMASRAQAIYARVERTKIEATSLAQSSLCVIICDVIWSTKKDKEMSYRDDESI